MVERTYTLDGQKTSTMSNPTFYGVSAAGARADTNLYTRMALAYSRHYAACHPKNPARELYLVLARKAARNARWHLDMARNMRLTGRPS